MLKQRRKIKYGLGSPLIVKHIASGRDMIWESTNKRQTKVSDLDINHLKNILKKFKKGDYNPDFFEGDLIENYLKTELIYRNILIQMENDGK
jgi:hypothetical protein